MAWSLDEVHAFFEDNERPISPFGSEMSYPWGWQVTAVPIPKEQPPLVNQGLDDVDEFVSDDDPWHITLTNKNQPGKQLSGVAQWVHQNDPKILSVDRNDFKLADDVAKKILFAAYWVSEEAHHGEGNTEPKDISSSDLFHLNRGEIELMKYLNDPEHYNKNSPEVNTHRGWDKVGTRVRNESAQSIKVNGWTCSKMINHDLWIIQGDTWHWPRQVDDRHGADEYLYSDPDEIMKRYPDMYIGFLPSVNIHDYYDVSDEPPVTTGDGLDDVDEFEPDDPEIDLQRAEDAEHMAARAVRESMFDKFATLDVPGFELLYVGAKGARESGVPVLRPFFIVGKKKPVTEDLDDKDEFTGEQLTPISTTIIYDPTKVSLPSAHVILIAGRIIIDNGYDVGEFVESNRTEKPNEIRIFGKLEISENIMLWIHDAGGQIEFYNYNINVILESPDVLALNRGIDA